MYYKTNYNSPIGQLTIAAHNNSLIGVWLEGQKYFQGSIKTELDFNDNIEVFQRTKAWLDRYFRGEKPEISELSLAPIGNDFRQNVWKILCEIPYGEVITYGDWSWSSVIIYSYSVKDSRVSTACTNRCKFSLHLCNSFFHFFLSE